MTFILGRLFQPQRTESNRTNHLHELGSWRCAKRQSTLAELDPEILCFARIRSLCIRQPTGKSTATPFVKRCGAGTLTILHLQMALEDLQTEKSAGVQRYKVYEAMFRVIKDSENVDERQHCFLLQTSGEESRYFSMETRQDLLKLESSWHRSVCKTVSQMGVR